MERKLVKSPLWWVGLLVAVALPWFTGCRDENHQGGLSESMKLTAKVLVLEHVGSSSDLSLPNVVIVENNFSKADALSFLDYSASGSVPLIQLLPGKQMDEVLQTARAVLNSAQPMVITNSMIIPYGYLQVKVMNRGSRNQCVIAPKWVVKLLKAIQPSLLMQNPNIADSLDDLIARLENVKD